MSQPNEDHIQSLADSMGIMPEYWDLFGERREVPSGTKLAILKAMGMDGALSGAAPAQKQNLIEPCHVFVEASIPTVLSLNPEITGTVTFHLSLRDEQGNAVSASYETSCQRGQAVDVPFVAFAGVAPGYYSLDVRCESDGQTFEGTSSLIIAPAQCRAPEARSWGITLSLYSLRSEANWGVGDLGDLRYVIEKVAGLGGGFVGISPLHAAYNSAGGGEGVSPYNPISRVFMNHIYIDMSDVPFATETDAKMQAAIDAARSSELVDYALVSRIKRDALEMACGAFMKAADAQSQRDFFDFIKKGGPALERFCAFMALRDELEGPGPGHAGFKDWPEKYQSPDSPDVEDFMDENPREMNLWFFAQWVLHRQLTELRAFAESKGVRIYGDLAVGSSGGGSDAWGFGDSMAKGATMGAPPDGFNADGQDWLFPPMVPSRLRDTGYDMFVRTIGGALRYCSMLRIDHALGLFRSFWIPQGMGAKQGAYVRYPSDDLLGIIALESQRNGAWVIAEDLGNISDDVREALGKRDMLSYRLLYFERDWDTGRFLSPAEYPDMAFAAPNTHDLPTLRAWWQGLDIDERKRMGLVDEDRAGTEHNVRQAERAAMLEAMNREGLLAGGGPDSPYSEVLLAVCEFLKRSNARLVGVSLDDLMGSVAQQNMPGVYGDCPNWRRKLPMTIEEAFEADGDKLIQSAAAIFNSR